ncbi:hypothetical protein [uncultured Devosia sp.]|uniref:hypothetical protein n=1 Tax=uncultured Devosia sp. TaxID=211434 RepID=UPI0035CC2487
MGQAVPTLLPIVTHERRFASRVTTADDAAVGRRRGSDDVGSVELKDLTGIAAEDFAVTAARYAKMPFALPTLSNRLKAFWNFSRTPLYPGWDLDKFDRDHCFPQPASARLAIHDGDWKQTHGATLAASTLPF